MSLKSLISTLISAVLVGLATWVAFGHYKPSSDGLTEEAVALSDMRRYCQVTKLDCTALRIQERVAPRQSNGLGHWEFVVRIGESGPHYMIAVTPGVESQVTPFGSR